MKNCKVAVQFRCFGWRRDVLMYRFSGFFHFWHELPFIYIVNPGAHTRPKIRVLYTVNHTDKYMVISELNNRVEMCGGSFKKFLKENKRLEEQYMLQERLHTMYNY